MNNLKVGFARIDITPMMGISLAGYFKDRFADGILDNIEMNAMAFECGDKRVILICLDHLGVRAVVANEFRDAISKATGVPFDAIFITATHTHTAPYIRPIPADELEAEYKQSVLRKIVDLSVFALEDMKPARMGFGTGKAPGVAFVRRFRMKDGSIQTNPGVNNPDILEPLGTVDETVNVVRFDREGADTLLIVNFANHPDTVGGNKISGDWPGFLRRTVEKSIDGTKVMYFNGAQGDVNHVNVHPKGGDFNDMFMDFDDVSRGYGHARYIGRVVAGGVFQCYDKVEYVDVDSIDFIEKTVSLPSNRPSPEQMPEARRINDLHMAGRDGEIPYTGMMLTTVVAEAERMIKLENGPDFFDLNMLCVRLGKVGLVGIAGEPFTGIGVALRDTPGYDMVMTVCTVNGDEGYFPMRSAYKEGGYESRSSEFREGVAEQLIDTGKALLKDIAQK